MKNTVRIRTKTGNAVLVTLDGEGLYADLPRIGYVAVKAAGHDLITAISGRRVRIQPNDDGRRALQPLLRELNRRVDLSILRCDARYLRDELMDMFPSHRKAEKEREYEELLEKIRKLDQ